MWGHHSATSDGENEIHTLDMPGSGFQNTDCYSQAQLVSESCNLPGSFPRQHFWLQLEQVRQTAEGKHWLEVFMQAACGRSIREDKQWNRNKVTSRSQEAYSEQELVFNEGWLCARHAYYLWALALVFTISILFYFEIMSSYVAQTGLELTILLSQLPKCWDYWVCVPPHMALWFV